MVIATTIVETAAIVGSIWNRISSQIFFGSVALPTPLKKRGKIELVERIQEHEHAGAHQAASDQWERHVTEDARSVGTQVCGGVLDRSVDILKGGGENDERDDRPPDAVTEHQGREGVDERHASEREVERDGGDDLRNDERRNEERDDQALDLPIGPREANCSKTTQTD